MKKTLTYNFLVRALVFSFVTLVIMNSINSYLFVKLVGSFGKFILAVLGILLMGIYLNKHGFKTRFKHLYLYILSYVLLLFFAIHYMITTDGDGNFIYNLVLPAYFIFYYFVIKSFLGFNFRSQELNSFEVTKADILKIYRSTLLVNMIFWFFLAFVNDVNMMDLGGLGGFFEDKIHFGLFAATGFLACFYLRYQTDNRDTSKFNLFLLLLFFILVFFTSRNAMLIVITAIFYYFILARIRSGFYIFCLLLLPFVILYYQDIFSFFSSEKMNELSTGRFEIWKIAFKEIAEKGVLMGSGIFNLNKQVLAENIETGFYYLDTLDFLFFHSSYLELFAGGGLILLGVFVYIMIRSWNTFSRIDKTLIISILMGGFVESYLVQPFMLISSLFYFLLVSNNFRLPVKSQEQLSNKSNEL